MIVEDFPDRPWQVLGTHLFHFKGRDYLLVVDFYSRYIEMALLSSTSSSMVVHHLKSIFARHGIPEKLRSDNGPQYSSYEFKQFCKSYGIDHVTSSPMYPQSNGSAERAVKTVKQLLYKAAEADQDLYLSLLAYRVTPLSNGFSPAQLLMGRQLRSTLPQMPTLLEPATPNKALVRGREERYKVQMKRNFD